MDFEDEDEDEEQEGEQRSKEPKIPISVYTSQGIRYQKLKLFSKALACYDAALKNEPNNEKCHLGRAKCLMSLAKFSEAKREAELALESNPGSPQAKALKAKAEYLLGDFEQSFITYRRAHKSRPNYDAFRIGQQECRRAIENALYPDDMWFDEEDVSQMVEVLSKKDGEAKDHQKPGASIRSRLYAEDVKCLKVLLSDKDLEAVHPECASLLDYLKDLQRFWRYQKPNTYKSFTKLYSSATQHTEVSHLNQGKFKL